MDEERKTFVKKIMRFLPMLTIVLWFSVTASSVCAKAWVSQSRLLNHAGESYATAQDPSYQNYDLALREYMVHRINKRFGIVLDPKIYSGFDLLEIEALFKCKKKEEPFDIFLKIFPKHP
ncbi:MAG: hypothetical protein A2026_21545 [Deltaproteobacteria bacterium RBG_19FT_COMBO_46_12]|nr:MAG: hypothetical protein A2026_21545 [Deltaproteobacteria bacterium RBG_19FT_COMBO_46_12]